MRVWDVSKDHCELGFQPRMRGVGPLAHGGSRGIRGYKKVGAPAGRKNASVNHIDMTCRNVQVVGACGMWNGLGEKPSPGGGLS